MPIDQPETMKAPSSASVHKHLKPIERKDFRPAVNGHAQSTGPVDSHTLHPNLKAIVRPDFRDPNHVPPPLPRISPSRGSVARPAVSAQQATAAKASGDHEALLSLKVELAALRDTVEALASQMSMVLDELATLSGASADGDL